MSEPRTLNELFFDAVDRYSTTPAALRYKAAGAWPEITHLDLARRVPHAALGLYGFGIRRGDPAAR